MTMKTITTIAAALFAANVSAFDIYYDLGEGNSDLSAERISAEDFVGVQPSIGDSVERYHGWADGNPDLFQVDFSGPTDSGDNPDIYMVFSGSPDLQY
jgi:hypothetical protein